MRRANADDVGVWRQSIDPQAFVVHGNRHDPGSRSDKGHAQGRIARILDRNDGLPRDDQRAREQVERLMSARGDPHLIGVARDRPGHRNVMRDCRA